MKSATCVIYQIYLNRPKTILTKSEESAIVGGCKEYTLSYHKKDPTLKNVLLVAYIEKQAKPNDDNVKYENTIYFTMCGNQTRQMCLLQI